MKLNLTWLKWETWWFFRDKNRTILLYSRLLTSNKATVAAVAPITRVNHYLAVTQYYFKSRPRLWSHSSIGRQAHGLALPHELFLTGNVSVSFEKTPLLLFSFQCRLSWSHTPYCESCCVVLACAICLFCCSLMVSVLLLMWACSALWSTLV